MPVYKQARLMRYRGREIPRCLRLKDIHGTWVTFLYVSQLPTDKYVGKIYVRNDYGRAYEAWPTILGAHIEVIKKTPGRRPVASA